MQIRLIQVPYDIGRYEFGMGKAPARFIEAGLVERLASFGHEVSLERVYVANLPADQIQASLAVNHALAEVVRKALAEDAFPLVLGGSCDLSLGILAAFKEGIGVVWVDAHGDFNTPETTPSGYFGGMPLAIATGHWYQEQWKQLGAEEPVAERGVVLVGARDLDPPERERLEQSKIQHLSVEDLRPEQQEPTDEDDYELPADHELYNALERLTWWESNVYLHLDIDVLDPQESPAVDFPAPNGFSVAEVEQILDLVRERCNVRAAILTAYNPDRDEQDKTLQAGLQLIPRLATRLSAIRKDAVMPARSLRTRLGSSLPRFGGTLIYPCLPAWFMWEQPNPWPVTLVFPDGTQQEAQARYAQVHLSRIDRTLPAWEHQVILEGLAEVPEGTEIWWHDK